MFTKKFMNILQKIDVKYTYPLMKIKSNIINKYNKFSNKNQEKTKSNGKVFICCIAKNEDDYIEEWIDYHIKIGFDKIVIFDNNEGFQLHEILKKYVKSNKIEIIDFKKKYNKAQFVAYNNFIKNYDFEYCAFIDLDEFITLRIHDNIKDFLKDYDKSDCIYLNWMAYGTNGQKFKKSGLVQDRFTKPTLPLTIKENYHVKSIVKNQKYSKFDLTPHDPYFYKGVYTTTYKKCKRSPFHYPDYRIAYIKHFETKSEEELKNKVKRGHIDTISDLKIESFLKQTQDSYFNPLPQIINKKNEKLIKYLNKNNINEIHLEGLNKELILNLFTLRNIKIIVHLNKLPSKELFNLLLTYSFVNKNNFNITFKPINKIISKDNIFILKDF